MNAFLFCWLDKPYIYNTREDNNEVKSSIIATNLFCFTVFIYGESKFQLFSPLSVYWIFHYLKFDLYTKRRVIMIRTNTILDMYISILGSHTLRSDTSRVKMHRMKPLKFYLNRLDSLWVS